MKKFIIFVLTIASLFTLFFGYKKADASTLPTEDNYCTCYQQGDYRWGQKLYRNQTFAATGCGQCSLTNVVNVLTGNFIHPNEVADYGYSIEAYNATSFSGTHQDIMYRKLENFEKKYGFKVVEGGTYFYNAPYATSIKVLKDALKKGQACILLVPGHFICLADYDELTNSFLTYDCAANPSSRKTYNCATWVTENEFKTVEKLNIEWYAIFESTTHRSTLLDGVKNKQNGKAETAYYINNPGVENPYVSGYALDDRGIDHYYYTLDYTSTEYSLSCTKRIDVDTTGFENVNEYKTGYKGVIDTTGLKAGTHYVNICAETSDGGVLTIAEIKLFVSGVEKYDSTNNALVLDMDNYIGQTDIHTSWPDGKVNKACFIANYNITVDMGTIDFSKFKKVDIYYSTNSNFDSNKDGTQSIIGFKKSANSFGYHGTAVDLNNEICHVNMTDGTSGSWSEFRVASIDLKNINYCGNTYINGYNQEGQFYVVSKVVFYYNDGYVLEDTNYNHVNNEQVVTPTLASDSTYSIGAYYLNDISYIEVEYNSNVNGNTIIKTSNNNVIDIKNGTKRMALNVNANTVEELFITTPSGSSIKEIKLYTKNSSAYHTDNGENHKVLEYHDALGNPIYKEERHVEVGLSVKKTCVVDGIDSIVCDYCGKKINETIDEALGHTTKIAYVDSEHHCTECSVCGEVIETVLHTFDTYKYNNTHHYKTCICGARENVEAHTFTKDGKCSVCECPCPHTSYTTIKGYEATCTEEGLSNGKVCKVCGKTFVEQEVIEPLDHEYENGVCVYCGEVQVAKQPESTGCKKGIDIASVLVVIPTIALAVGFRKISRKKEEE